MDEFKEAKEWITHSMTTSQFITAHPCLVSHICLSAGGAGNPTALIYNGESGTSPLRLGIACWASQQQVERFRIPVYFSRGIYVALSANVVLFTIQYKEEVKF